MGFSLFGLSGADLAIGGITTALSFVPVVGTAASAIVGGAAAAVQAKMAGEDWDEALQQGVVVGALGALPGGAIAGGVLRKLATSGGGKLAKLGLQKGASKILYGGATGAAKGAITRGTATSIGERSVKALGRGLGAAYANSIYRNVTSSSPAGIAELPVKMIS